MENHSPASSSDLKLVRIPLSAGGPEPRGAEHLPALVVEVADIGRDLRHPLFPGQPQLPVDDAFRPTRSSCSLL